jgi:hypothetical protein
MIPPGYAAAIYAWAISPEVSEAVQTERKAALLAERDALITGGVTSGGKGVRDLISGSANGKSFQKDSLMSTTLSPVDKLAVLNDVLDRLGALAEDARPVTTTHAIFPCLQR